MIACLSPSDANYEENSRTLAYAEKANSIYNCPIINKDRIQSYLEVVQESKMLLYQMQ